MRIARKGDDRPVSFGFSKNHAHQCDQRVSIAHCCAFACEMRSLLRPILTATALLAVLPAAAAERTAWTTSRVLGSPEPPAPCRVERIVPLVSFKEPADFCYEPSSGRWFVSQLDGRLFSFPAADGAQAIAAPAGNLAEAHKNWSQLLGFTFHPNFAQSRFVFAAYTTLPGGPGSWKLSRFTMSRDTPPHLDLTSETVLLTERGGGHDGCSLKFGPDGMLYVSLGDAASPEPPDMLRTGQDCRDFLSSILRIDVDHADDGRAYRVPADNPFTGRADVKPEIWAFGFRNPWRTSFAPDGALWVGDVGWELWESIHRVTAGYNAGWSVQEGPNRSVCPDVKPGPAPVRPALKVHGHHESASITGGFFYQGARLPWLRGAYVYGDFETGKIWALRSEGDRVTWEKEIADTTLKVVAFAPMPDGELAVLDHTSTGGIYQLAANDAPQSAAPFPGRLSETGLFENTGAQTPAAGVEPFAIAVPAWEDHATGERWIAAPGTAPVRAMWHRGEAYDRRWQFPPNTVLAKTLSLEMKAGDPATRRRVETQVLHFTGESWAAYSYRWNEAQTDADLVPAAGAEMTLSIADDDAPEGRREQAWRLAGRAECLRCHNTWAGPPLSFNCEQLLTPAAHEVSEIHRLAEKGWITLPAELPKERLVPPHDPHASLTDRARSWLHANCAQCHRQNAGGSASVFFNHELPLDRTRLVDQPPVRGAFGISDARILAPGRPERSTLWFRTNTEGQGHMPPIGPRMVDESGARLLAEWIESLASQSDRASPGFDTTTAALASLCAAQRDTAKLRDAVKSAQTSPEPLVRELFERFLPASQRRKTLGADFPATAVLSLSGDAARGRTLFREMSGCAVCHVAEGKGRAFGPDLSGIGRKYERAALLEHIVHPSVAIAEEFRLHVLTLKDGTTRAGIIAAQNDRELILVTVALERMTIEKSQIAKDEPAPVSAMPEGLLDHLTAAEAADMLSYLASLTGAAVEGAAK